MAPDPRTTPILDDLQRANENPLSFGGKWGPVATDRNQLRLGTSGFSDSGKHITRQSGSSRSYSIWLPEQFDGDCEVWGRRLMITDNSFGHNDRIGLVTDVGGLMSAVDGYHVYVHKPNGPVATILYRITNGAATQIGIAEASPEWLLLRRLGDQVQVWGSSDPADTWTSILDVTDTNYTTGLSLMFGEGTNYPSTSVFSGWEYPGGGQQAENRQQIIRRVVT